MASGSKTESSIVAQTTCQYSSRKCHQPVIQNYSYCTRHILEDKSAPYRPCSFTYPNSNKKCPLAAPKGDKRDTGYCQMHLWKLLLKRQKSSAKSVPPITTESLLSELSHYVRPVRSSLSKSNTPEKSDPSVTTALNPFVDVDVSKAWLRRVQVLECGSESDSDCEPATLDNVNQAYHEDSSDAESIDSQMEDPLRYCGVLTDEEAVLLARNKMMRLQMLYQKQYDKILMTLKEKRRQYLSASKKERETYCSVYDQSKNSAKDKKMYEKLRSLHRYHRKSNRETIAYLASQEKKAKQSGVVKSSTTKCSFTEGGVRCGGQTLPLTKYCFKHILQDQNQCIFRACGCVKADSLCQEPIVELSGDETCILHYKLQPLPHLPSTSNEGYNAGPEKTLEGESELDASATESAISTDNGVLNDEVLPIESDNLSQPSYIQSDADLKPSVPPDGKQISEDVEMTTEETPEVKLEPCEVKSESGVVKPETSDIKEEITGVANPTEDVTMELKEEPIADKSNEASISSSPKEIEKKEEIKGNTEEAPMLVDNDEQYIVIN